MIAGNEETNKSCRLIAMKLSFKQKIQQKSNTKFKKKKIIVIIIIIITKISN
jgi:hypothetical protein